MKLSAESHYGLQACYIIASKGGALVSASALEGGVGVSKKYLERIMRALKSRGIIAAARGKDGGYFLQKEASEITVGDIVRTFENDFEIIRCVNREGCTCPSQAVWQKLYEKIVEVMDSMTLADMLKKKE